MAVRFSADGQKYTATLSLGSQLFYTVACWTKLVGAGTWSCPWNLDNGVPSQSIYMENTGSGGTAYTIYRNDSNPMTGSISMTVGTWYYTCTVVDDVTCTVYYRAASAATLSTISGTFSSEGNTLTNLRLGDSIYGSEWFNGALQGFKMWTGALTADQALAESLSQRPVRWDSLAMWYPFVLNGTADYTTNARTLSGGSGTATEEGPTVPWGRSLIRPRRYAPPAATPFAGWGVPIL